MRILEGSNQGTIELLTTADGNLSAVGNGEAFTIAGSYKDVKFWILASNTPSFTAIIEHSPDGVNWALLGTFNGGAISVAQAYSLVPAQGASAGPYFRLKISSWTSGQIDQTDKNGATQCHCTKTR